MAELVKNKTITSATQEIKKSKAFKVIAKSVQKEYDSASVNLKNLVLKLKLKINNFKKEN